MTFPDIFDPDGWLPDPGPSEQSLRGTLSHQVPRPELAYVSFADGYKWVNRGPETDDHLALGGHEAGLEPIMASMADPDKAFLNVGAHVGTWAVRMAKNFRHVYAIEANSETADVLQANAMLNDLDKKITIFVMAAWDNDTDFIKLVDDNGKESGGSTRAVPFSGNANGLQTRRLDGFTWPTIGLIVMDIEGAEARALRGAKELIARDRPNMIIELHEGHPGTDADLRAQVYSVLDELGYEYHSVDITGERLLCYPEALAEFPAEC